MYCAIPPKFSIFSIPDRRKITTRRILPNNIGKAFNHSIENLLIWIPPASHPEVLSETGKSLSLYHKSPFRSS
jgi:hypothetical protein